MATPAQHNLSNANFAVREVLSDASIEALNLTLTEKGIAPEAIVSILQVPGKNLIDPSPAQFRVLYRL